MEIEIEYNHADGVFVGVWQCVCVCVVVAGDARRPFCAVSLSFNKCSLVNTAEIKEPLSFNSTLSTGRSRRASSGVERRRVEAIKC